MTEPNVELPTHHEVAAIAGFAMQLPHSVDGWQLEWATSLTVAPRDCWLHVRFEPKPPHPAEVAGVSLVLWRASLAVYPLLEDQSVPEDPITPEEFRERIAT